jgi:hypothetical protein
MSCNNKAQIIAHKPSKTASFNEPATLREHFVLHRLSKEEVMLFDPEIEEPKANANNNHSNRKMSALDAATTMVMDERQRCASAPAKINTPTMTATTNTAKNTATAADGAPTKSNTTTEPETEAETETKLRAALLASLEPTAQPKPQASPSSPDFAPPSSRDHITFGPKQLSALSPEIQHSESKRQESLVKTRSTASLTIQKRRLLLADEAGAIREEDVVMSGALDWADVRCEVCAARERAMSGLEEAGIVAL